MLTKKHLWLLLFAALLVRLISLALYPLMDTTEARYGEMARLMVETGNWLTPQFDYGIPFWGKPPLFTWMSALGIEGLGVNEFAVRVPHWIAGVLTIGLMALLAKRASLDPLVVAVVLATTAIFSISSGAVMTDMALTFGMTLAVVGFYLCWKGEKVWGYIGFFGLAVGLLAKGPVAIVIFGLAVFPWMVVQHGFIGAFVELWQRFPLAKGAVLMLAIALPWYLMAENATPGFIDYFIVGEHFKRFVVSGWEGDLYGSAHDEPRGMIWAFWLVSALPWSLVVPALFLRGRKSLAKLNQQHEGLLTLALFWLISPMVLFTFAGNILPAYVLPGVPALGILMAMLIQQSDGKWFKRVAYVVPALLVFAVVFLNLGKADSRSDRALLSKLNDELPTYYVGKRPFSGQFYSRGQAKLLTEESDLSVDEFYLIGKHDRAFALIEERGLKCDLVMEAKTNRKAYYCTNALVIGDITRMLSLLEREN